MSNCGVTPLQEWIRAAADLLDDARADLGPREFSVLLDVLISRIARLGCDEFRAAA